MPKVTTPALYVACLGNGGAGSHVIALDPDLDLQGYITLDTAYASRLAMRPDGYRLWVSHPNHDANRLTVLNAVTLEPDDDLTIQYGGEEHRPYTMVVRTVGGRKMFPQLMVACTEVNKILVYDMYTGSRAFYEFDVDTRRLTEGEAHDTADPAYVKLHPNARRLYVYSEVYGKDSVRIIDLGDDLNLNDAAQGDEICFTPACKFSTSSQLQESVFNPDGSRLYIANRGQDRIEIIDTSENRFLEQAIEFPDFKHPRSLAISGDGNYLYAGYSYTAAVDPPTGYVAMIRLDETPRVVDHRTIPSNPKTMVLNSSGDRLFVSEHGTHEIYAFDIDIEAEIITLFRSINLDEIVDTGYAGPVEILYLEERHLVPLPYAVINRWLFPGSSG